MKWNWKTQPHCLSLQPASILNIFCRCSYGTSPSIIQSLWLPFTFTHSCGCLCILPTLENVSLTYLFMSHLPFLACLQLTHLICIEWLLLKADCRTQPLQTCFCYVVYFYKALIVSHLMLGSSPNSIAYYLMFFMLNFLAAFCWKKKNTKLRLSKF